MGPSDKPSPAPTPATEPPADKPSHNPSPAPTPATKPPADRPLPRPSWSQEQAALRDPYTPATTPPQYHPPWTPGPDGALDLESGSYHTGSDGKTFWQVSDPVTAHPVIRTDDPTASPSQSPGADDPTASPSPGPTHPPWETPFPGTQAPSPTQTQAPSQAQSPAPTGDAFGPEPSQTHKPAAPAKRPTIPPTKTIEMGSSLIDGGRAAPEDLLPNHNIWPFRPEPYGPDGNDGTDHDGAGHDETPEEKWERIVDQGDEDAGTDSGVDQGSNPNYSEEYNEDYLNLYNEDLGAGRRFKPVMVEPVVSGAADIGRSGPSRYGDGTAASDVDSAEVEVGSATGGVVAATDGPVPTTSWFSYGSPPEQEETLAPRPAPQGPKPQDAGAQSHARALSPTVPSSIVPSLAPKTVAPDALSPHLHHDAYRQIDWPATLAVIVVLFVLSFILLIISLKWRNRNSCVRRLVDWITWKLTSCPDLSLDHGEDLALEPLELDEERRLEEERWSEATVIKAFPPSRTRWLEAGDASYCEVDARSECTTRYVPVSEHSGPTAVARAGAQSGFETYSYASLNEDSDQIHHTCSVSRRIAGPSTQKAPVDPSPVDWPGKAPQPPLHSPSGQPGRAPTHSYPRRPSSKLAFPPLSQRELLVPSWSRGLGLTQPARPSGPARDDPARDGHSRPEGTPPPPSYPTHIPCSSPTDSRDPFAAARPARPTRPHAPSTATPQPGPAATPILGDQAGPCRSSTNADQCGVAPLRVSQPSSESSSRDNFTCMQPSITVHMKTNSADQIFSTGCAALNTCEQAAGVEYPLDLKNSKLLGKGSFGACYLAEMGGVKVVIKAAIGSSIGQKEITHEASILHKLGRHPTLIEYYGWCNITLHGRTTVGVVYAYYPGGSLYKYIKKKDKAGHRLWQWYRTNPATGSVELTEYWTLIIKFGQNIAAGVKYLHSKEVLHRDLAGRNILLTDDTRGTGVCAVVGDIGFSVKNGKQGLNSMVVSTRWAAPEVVQHGSSAYSEKSDVWSFAVVLWEMLSCGQIPWGSVRDNRAVKERLTAESTSEDACAQYVGPRGGMPVDERVTPAWMVQLLRSCFNRDPRERPSMASVDRTFKEARSAKSRAFVAQAGRTS